MFGTKVKAVVLVFLAVAVFKAGDFTQFLGENRSGVVTTGKNLLKKWPEEGLKELWRIPVAGGFATPAISQDKLFLLDYDLSKEEDTVR